MKKLFISCPMKGRTEEDIRKSMEKMHKIAEIIFEQELEVIPTYIEDNPPECREQRLWYLGESIKMMARADYFVGPYYSSYAGCEVEKMAAELYEVPRTYVHIADIAPDLQRREMLSDAGVMPCFAGE